MVNYRTKTIIERRFVFTQAHYLRLQSFKYLFQEWSQSIGPSVTLNARLMGIFCTYFPIDNVESVIEHQARETYSIVVFSLMDKCSDTASPLFFPVPSEARERRVQPGQQVGLYCVSLTTVLCCQLICVVQNHPRLVTLGDRQVLQG